MKLTIKDKRQKVKHRIRKTVIGSAERPRLSVFRSNTQMYCQLIDDSAGKTICAASTKDKSIGKASKSEQAKQVGELIASKAKLNNISAVVFDRGGFLYHGRVKQLAEGAREGGLIF
jgi:large subunit ribosomal protein L18